MSATMKQYSGQMIEGLINLAELQARCDRQDRIFTEYLSEKVALELITEGVICTKCGDLYKNHRGCDTFQPTCPHPRRFELGHPLYIEGQFFSVTPQRCTHVAARNSEDTEGVLCREICEPGKSFCSEHYEE